MMTDTANTTDSANRGSAPSGVPATMSATVRHRYGPADAVTIERVPVPEPGPNQVLVEVVAAGAPSDVAALAGWLWQGPPAARVEAVHVEEWTGDVPRGFAVAK